MAKKSRRKHKHKTHATSGSDEFEELDESDEEEGIGKQRRRSQEPVRLKMSRKKQDLIVIFIALIILGVVGIGYLFTTFDFGGSEGGKEKLETNGTTDLINVSMYSGKIQIVSDMTNKWGKSSWHILDHGGETDFMVKVTNTGAKTDTYKLIDENPNPYFQVLFDKNNLKLSTGKSTLVIVSVNTNKNDDYRLQPSIFIKLESEFLDTILDSVKIDITVNKLDADERAQTGDKVSAYYTGAFWNGTLFDYSFKIPEEPILRISLSNGEQFGGLENVKYVPVIEGFKDGVIGMIPGETRVIIVPPELGYPEEHELGGETLIFHVRLLSNDRET